MFQSGGWRETALWGEVAYSPCLYVSLVQSVDTAGLSPVISQFESEERHHVKGSRASAQVNIWESICGLLNRMSEES